MELNFFGRRKKPRQEWKPHWSIKILYALWMTAFSAFKIAIGAAATVLMICMICGLVFVGILGDYLQEDILPESENYELTISDMAQTSFVYGVDGDGNVQLLQQIHTTDDRQWASIDDIPENLINATVAIEDKRFYEHQGVDWITTVKACVNMFMGGKSQFGGSTITQQLIKNKTGEDSITVQRKVMEIFRAQNAERRYDKDTILEWYLNTIYLGRGCYGVKSAAAEYFGKELQSLTLAECASLISITNNPSLYNPLSTSEYEFRDYGMTDGKTRNKIRQKNVLEQMREQEMITAEEYYGALYQELEFKSGISDEDIWSVCDNEECGYEGTAGTFTVEGEASFCPVCGTQTVVQSNASQVVYSYFVDTVLEDVAEDLAAKDGITLSKESKETKEMYMNQIKLGGYHIYTTLDLKVQEQVDAVYTDLSRIPTARSNQQLQSAIVVIDNRSGDIVGMAGGVGEKLVHDGLNRATDSDLQTGSSQKPLSVYAPAFESGEASPVTVIQDMPLSYDGNTPFPRNDDRKYQYSRTIFDGIRRSVNAVAARTLDLNPVEYSFNFAKERFGQAGLTESYMLASGRELSDMAASPLALGALTIGATVREMSAAYATFPNNGVYREARTYTKVYDSQGNIVLDNTQDSREILSAKTVNYMNYCLTYAVLSGTGGVADMVGQDVAGKTGTTSSNKDRWFCGFTGYYTAAVWCGYDIPEEIRLTGDTSNPAARLWNRVMTPLHSGKNRIKLFSTAGMRNYTVCLDCGKLATDACKNDVRGIARTATAMAYPEDAPSGHCTCHVMLDYCVTGGGVATDYCSKFEDVEIERRSLVKLNEDQINAIKKAGKSGLSADYLEDGYVYYITDGGNPKAWHGFDGKLQKELRVAYIVCPEHDKEAWEKYQAEQEKEQENEETKPTE